MAVGLSTARLRLSHRLPALFSAVSEQQQMRSESSGRLRKRQPAAASSSSQPPRGGPTCRLDRGGCTVCCLWAVGLAVLLLHCRFACTSLQLMLAYDCLCMLCGCAWHNGLGVPVPGTAYQGPPSQGARPMPARVRCQQLHGVLHDWRQRVQRATQLVCGLPLGCDLVCHASAVAGVLGAFPSVTVSG